MKLTSIKSIVVVLTSILATVAIVSVSQGQAAKNSDSSNAEKAVLARLDEIQKAAQELDADKVFSYVLENNNGALVQNGKLLLTRKDALESTIAGFAGLQKISYQFNQQHVTLLSPTIALVVGEGSSTAITDSGRTVTRPFAQSVIFVLTNKNWMVIHAHRSLPPQDQAGN